MKTRYIVNLLSLFLLCSLFNVVLAQKTVLYNISQSASMEINPAHKVKTRGSYFTLPILNYQEFNINAGGLSYDKIIKKESTATGTKLLLDYNHILSNLRSSNTLGLSAEFGLLGIGIANRKDYYSFSVKEKAIGQFQYSKKFLDLFMNGVAIEELPNGQKKYRDGSTGSLFFDVMHYREFAFGYDRAFDDRFSLGIRFKLLFGMAGLSTSGMRVDITSEDLNAMNLSTYGRVNISGPVEFDVVTNEDGVAEIKNSKSTFSSSYFTETGNLGAAVDLGIEFTPNDTWCVGLSLIDLGAISYKTNTKQIYTDSSYRYEGVDISNSVNKDKEGYVSFSDAMDNLVTEAKSKLKVEDSEQSFSQKLPLQLYVNGIYSPVKWFDTSLLLKHRSFQYFTDNGLHLSANLHCKWVDFSTQYTWNNVTNSGLGFGVNLKLGPLHLYAATDNILPLMGTNYSLYSSYRMGMNFVIDRKNKRQY